MWCDTRKIKKLKQCLESESNTRPSDLQSDALPTELSRPITWWQESTLSRYIIIFNTFQNKQAQSTIKNSTNDQDVTWLSWWNDEGEDDSILGLENVKRELPCETTSPSNRHVSGYTTPCTLHSFVSCVGIFKIEFTFLLCYPLYCRPKICFIWQD